MPSTDYVLFYALYGETMHYRPQPASNNTLVTYYLQYPARVVNDGDTLPLERYEEFIMAFATEYFWATQEESESQQAWQKMADRMGMPLQMLQQARNLTRGEEPSGDIRRTI